MFTSNEKVLNITWKFLDSPAFSASSMMINFGNFGIIVLFIYLFLNAVFRIEEYLCA
jgi:hypothetical protein